MEFFYRNDSFLDYLKKAPKYNKRIYCLVTKMLNWRNVLGCDADSGFLIFISGIKFNIATFSIVDY